MESNLIMLINLNHLLGRIDMSFLYLLPRLPFARVQKNERRLYKPYVLVAGETGHKSQFEKVQFLSYSYR